MNKDYTDVIEITDLSCVDVIFSLIVQWIIWNWSCFTEPGREDKMRKSGEKIKRKSLLTQILTRKDASGIVKCILCSPTDNLWNIWCCQKGLWRRSESVIGESCCKNAKFEVKNIDMVILRTEPHVVCAWRKMAESKACYSRKGAAVSHTWFFRQLSGLHLKRKLETQKGDAEKMNWTFLLLFWCSLHLWSPRGTEKWKDELGTRGGGGVVVSGVC